jgi:pyridinium-3,5-biscarboxylic acid mononucleotide synthase
MEHGSLRKVLAGVADGSMNIEAAMKKLSTLPFEDMGFARVDHHRVLRKGYAEVIFCQNKTPRQVVDISKSLMKHWETVFGTRASNETLALLKKELNGVAVNAAGRCFWKKAKHWKKRDSIKGTIVIASAGTADLPVVEEAKCTVEVLGHP